MAELADAKDSRSFILTDVRVRVPPWAFEGESSMANHKSLSKIAKTMVSLTPNLTQDEIVAVMADLETLTNTGEWRSPAWAKELGDYLDVSPGHPSVTSIGWRAVAVSLINLLKA